MPENQFDAGLEDLTYDFTKYVPGAKGTIPEPTSEQIKVLVETLQKVMPTKTVKDQETGQERHVLDLDKIREMYGEDGDEIDLTMAAALGEVCSNQPSGEQILALPYRVKRRFTGWLLGSLLSPEA